MRNINYGRGNVIVNIEEIFKMNDDRFFDDETAYVDGELFIQMVRRNCGADNPMRWREVSKIYLRATFHKREEYFKFLAQARTWVSGNYYQPEKAKYWIKRAREVREEISDPRRFHLPR